MLPERCLFGYLAAVGICYLAMGLGWDVPIVETAGGGLFVASWMVWADDKLW